MMFPTQEGQLGTFLPSRGTGRGHLRPREVPLSLTPLTRKGWGRPLRGVQVNGPEGIMFTRCLQRRTWGLGLLGWIFRDRKSTRLNSSHVAISYAVFCLKKKIVMSYGS